MFENSPHKDYRYAIDRDGQHRLCCAIEDRRTRSIVATFVETRLEYHVPATPDVIAAVSEAAQPFMDRLQHEGITA
ncbi:MAG: hypothetical protein JXR15_13105 [Shimia sp.]|uniref:hypothetical protein n=1 Tax=Shimia sp. TaxID=1954381 RepID=UPI003B8DCFF7